MLASLRTALRPGTRRWLTVPVPRIRGFSSDAPFGDDLQSGEDVFREQLADFYEVDPESLPSGRSAKRQNRQSAAPPLSSSAISDISTAPQLSQTPSHLSETVAQPGPAIFISNSHNPHFNLALEDYIFENFSASEPNFGEKPNRLVLYTNEPCVVIGKNQNPWKEVNLPVLNSLLLPLLRRKSGGGAVVHDAGNCNFSYMTKKSDFSRDGFSRLLVEEVNRYPPGEPVTWPTETGTLRHVAGPAAELALNERFDIVDAESGEKVSGSAYKIVRHKAYHHGTMLLSSRLDVLKSLLRRDETRLGFVVGRGTDSVPSPVRNLGLDGSVFENCCIKAFQRAVESTDVPIYRIDEIAAVSELKDKIAELKSWQWTYGTTPLFTHTLTHPELDFRVVLTVNRGCLTNVEVEAHEGLQYEGEDLRSQFVYLEAQAKTGKLPYVGSRVAGFIPKESLGDWLGGCIDGTS